MAERALVWNQDNDGLLPYGCDGNLYGCLDDVNGLGGNEVPEFVPTRRELVEIAKYWERTRLNNMFSFYEGRQCGGPLSREARFASRRIDRVKRLLGNEAVSEAFDLVEQEFRKIAGPEYWERFKAEGPQVWSTAQEWDD